VFPLLGKSPVDIGYLSGITGAYRGWSNSDKAGEKKLVKYNSISQYLVKLIKNNLKFEKIESNMEDKSKDYNKCNKQSVIFGIFKKWSLQCQILTLFITCFVQMY